MKKIISLFIKGNLLYKLWQGNCYLSNVTNNDKSKIL
jgi:hypothetical protein